MRVRNGSHFFFSNRGDSLEVKISQGNIKMGAIPSVSLPAGKTCAKNCKCFSKCYARKLERLRKTVRDAYQHNLELLFNDPDTYWREVEAAIMLTRFFRFHVSGDIVNDDYLNHMVKIAEKNQHCQILCFTKRYDIINKWLDINHQFPSNLHIIFSIWKDFKYNNKYSLPEAHVRYRDGTTTVKENYIECNGNCAECAKTDGGCWTLESGQAVVFNEH